MAKDWVTGPALEIMRALAQKTTHGQDIPRNNGIFRAGDEVLVKRGDQKIVGTLVVEYLSTGEHMRIKLKNEISPYWWPWEYVVGWRRPA